MPAFLVDTSDGATPTAAAGSPSPAPPPRTAESSTRPKWGPLRWPPREEQRMLRLGVVGIPNAGKSTLTNALVGGTVTAVSVRPETTRQPVLGCFTEGNSQARHALSVAVGLRVFCGAAALVAAAPGQACPGCARQCSMVARARGAVCTNVT